MFVPLCVKSVRQRVMEQWSKEREIQYRRFCWQALTPGLRDTWCGSKGNDPLEHWATSGCRPGHRQPLAAFIHTHSSSFRSVEAHSENPITNVLIFHLSLIQGAFDLVNWCRHIPRQRRIDARAAGHLSGKKAWQHSLQSKMTNNCIHQQTTDHIWVYEG